MWPVWLTGNSLSLLNKDIFVTYYNLYIMVSIFSTSDSSTRGPNHNIWSFHNIYKAVSACFSWPPQEKFLQSNSHLIKVEKTLNDVSPKSREFDVSFKEFMQIIQTWHESMKIDIIYPLCVHYWWHDVIFSWK